MIGRQSSSKVMGLGASVILAGNRFLMMMKIREDSKLIRMAKPE
jgi:hypothetical protein